MEAQVDTSRLLTQPKEGQQQFKNKKQSELTENQTVWKSNNQRDKEETFIQTSRRGGARQQSGEDSQEGNGWQTQRGGGLWNVASQAAAGRPHKMMSGGPCSPTFSHR